MCARHRATGQRGRKACSTDRASAPATTDNLTILRGRDCRKGDALTFPIRSYRPEPPRRESPLLWAAPGLLLAGALLGHLIEAAWR